MTICPWCRYDNIDGMDLCDDCQESLSELSLPPPVTNVQRRLLSDRVGTLRTSGSPIVTAPDTPIRQVLDLLVQKSIGCVLIVEGDKLIGIFSERDALMRIGANAAKLANRPVSEFMTPSPQTLRVDVKIAFAVKLMDLGGYRHVPVVDAQDRLQGIISVRDMLRYLTEQMAEE